MLENFTKNLKCFILHDIIVDKESHVGEFKIVVKVIIFLFLNIIASIFFAAILGMYIQGAGPNDDINFVGLITFIVTFIISAFCIPAIFNNHTRLFNDYYVDGICSRCEKMFFEAYNEEVRVGKQKAINKVKLEKFSKLSKLRSKALGSSGGGSHL